MEIKPAAMAIPQDTSTLPQGKWGPIFPKTPACYGFSIIAKIKPGTEANFYEYARGIEAGVAATPDLLDVLKLHYLRWNLFDINGETYSSTWAFSTPISTNTLKMPWRSFLPPV